MEKNMGFGLALGLWAVLKTVQPKLSLATFEGSFFLCFYGQFLNIVVSTLKNCIHKFLHGYLSKKFHKNFN